MAIVTLLNEEGGRAIGARSISIGYATSSFLSATMTSVLSRLPPLAVCSAPLERSDEAIISFVSADEREEGIKRVIRANIIVKV